MQSDSWQSSLQGLKGNSSVETTKPPHPPRSPLHIDKLRSVSIRSPTSSARLAFDASPDPSWSLICFSAR